MYSVSLCHTPHNCIFHRFPEFPEFVPFIGTTDRLMCRDSKNAALYFRSLSLSPLRPTAIGGSAIVQRCKVSASVRQIMYSYMTISVYIKH